MYKDSTGGDRNRPKETVDYYLVPRHSQITIYGKLPGKLSNNRWAYRDNPWNGLDEKEWADFFRRYENISPWETQ